MATGGWDFVVRLHKENAENAAAARDAEVTLELREGIPVNEWRNLEGGY